MSDPVGFVIILLLGLALLFTIIFGGIFIVLRNTARQKDASARERYPAARQIDPRASFFGRSHA